MADEVVGVSVSMVGLNYWRQRVTHTWESIEGKFLNAWRQRTEKGAIILSHDTWNHVVYT